MFSSGVQRTGMTDEMKSHVGKKEDEEELERTLRSASTWSRPGPGQEASQRAWREGKEGPVGAEDSDQRKDSGAHESRALLSGGKGRTRTQVGFQVPSLDDTGRRMPWG